MTPTVLKIDFVSDVACPWCAVGLASLDHALAELQGEIAAEVHCQPYELNPTMPPEGCDPDAYLAEKYGRTPEQLAEVRELLRQRGAAVDFTFRPEGRAWMWNTLDAHRLLYWAAEVAPAQQLALKRALVKAYHSDGLNIADPEVLAGLAAGAGLDGAQARQVLAEGRYADDVRSREAYYQRAGIQGVPAVIVNDRHLIQGGQPPAVFVQALRQIAAEPG